MARAQAQAPRLYFDPQSGCWRRRHKTTTSSSMVPELAKIPAGSSKTMDKAAFERLPDEIIEQILKLTNPNGFASLIILNRKWRTVSQQAHLYIHHLSRCPSYSAAHPSITIPATEDDIPRLRRLFAQEIKRNLFEAYLRPRETVISLVSNSISSSSAPGGEAFHFSLSPRGHFVLAYSSSRIYVLDATGPEIEVRRELKILRRPASTTITDDGSLLAVLSTDLQIDLYDLSGEHPKHIRAVSLDHTPRTIALSPNGGVVAAAYDAGVEVSSLEPECTGTERRAVKCYAVDSLAFSKDGTQLLGSTIQSPSPSTVVITAPYYDPGASFENESVSALWTTSILFPNGSRDCSHACLLPSATEEEASWTFTYDRVFETFRAVRVDDLRNGTTYFTGPVAETASILKLIPSTLPAATRLGDLVAAGFQGSIWLYGVPEDLEALPNPNNGASHSDTEPSTPISHIGRRNSAPSMRSGHKTRDSTSRVPQWQLLCDRARNTFVEGRKIGSLDRVSAMTWVNDVSSSFHGEKLIAVAPGIVNTSPISEDDGMNPVDGGRISILEFDYSTTDGTKRMITIEVGMNEPEVLEEEHRDFRTEVAIVRRRTVAQRRGNRRDLARAATSATPLPRPEPPPIPRFEDDLGDPFAGPTNLNQRRASQATAITEQSEVSSVYEQEALDDPYSHTMPRSGTTLRRAATAAAVNRRLHPRSVAQDHIEYRRADGREEHPHESDADNWVPPPPPYSKDPIPALPEHIQRSINAEAAAAANNLHRASTYHRSVSDTYGLDIGTVSRSRTMTSSSTGSSRRDRFAFTRSMSDYSIQRAEADRVSLEHESPQSVHSPQNITSPVSPAEYDSLYDVSPPGTPPGTRGRGMSNAEGASAQPASAAVNPSEHVNSREESTDQILNERTQSVTDREHVVTREVPTAPNESVSRVPINVIPRRPVGTSTNSNSAIPAPPPAMLGTLQQPISPVPQPTQPSESDLDSRLRDWEETSSRPTPPVLNTTTLLPPPAISEEFGNEDFTVRSTEDYHLTEPAPDTPIIQDRRALIESLQAVPVQPASESSPERDPSPLRRRAVTSPANHSSQEMEDEEPLPIWKRSGTAPVPQNRSVSGPAPRFSSPSADQMARLNNRMSMGRPPSIADPSRRFSGSHVSPQQQLQQRAGSSPNRQTWGTMQRLNTEQALQSSAPRAAAGAYGSPVRSSPVQQSPGYPMPTSTYRNNFNSPTRHTNSPHGSLRPPMHSRLDTIQSAPEETEPSAYVASKKAINVSRRFSQVKRTKSTKKSWRQSSMPKRKKAASEPDWTDVSMPSVPRGGFEAQYGGKVTRGPALKDKKSAKCDIM